MPAKKKADARAAPAVVESLECKTTAAVWTRKDEAAGLLTVGLRLRVRDSEGRPIQSPSGHHAEAPDNTFTLPLSLFESDEQIGEFAAGILARFAAFGPLLLAEQGAVYLNAVAELQRAKLAPHFDDPDEKLLQAEHLKDTEYILNFIYGVSTRGKGNGGRPAKWTKDELTFEIVRALRNLERGCQTQRRVTERLIEWHGERAPASKGAFQQQILALGIDWTELKRTHRKD